MTGRVTLFLFASLLVRAQSNFEQNGYVEYRMFGFPQLTRNDRGNFIGEGLIHYDLKYAFAPGWRLIGGTETRSDTHRQTERQFRLNWDDRGLKRPNFSIRHLSLEYNRGSFMVQAGKQVIRWGRTDLLTPVDRFAPRDYLTVVDTDVLAVNAIRGVVEGAKDTVEVVVQPLFTPSRIPLINQRWSFLPQALPMNDQGSRFPGGLQWGARWNHSGSGYEVAFSVYDGHNTMPLLEFSKPGQLLRTYPQMRMYGLDGEVPLRLVTIKGEAAFFASSTRNADEYVLYVVEVERDAGAWAFSGAYAGGAVTRRGGSLRFTPDRGLARAFLGRVTYTIDANRSVTSELALRQNGKGLLLKTEFLQSWGQHLRGTVGFTLLRGDPADFLGQYRRNSYASLGLRYSF